MAGNEIDNGPEFSVECATVIATVLTCVLAPAVQFAVMPDSLQINADPPADRLETLRQKLLSEAKDAIADGAPYSLEAKGKTEAMAIIDWVCDCVKDQIDHQ